MTDARFPERWLIDVRFRRLTDRAYRTYSKVLLWVVGNRTDGILMPEDMPFIPEASIEDVAALVQQNLWQVRADGGWLIARTGATGCG